MTSTTRRRNRILSAFYVLLLFSEAAYPVDDAAERLVTQAQSQLAAGRYAEVLQSTAAAIRLFREAGSRSGEGRALNILGLAHLYSGVYSPALDNFNNALQIARDENDTSSEIVRLNNIGNVHYYQGYYFEALTKYQEARQRVESAGAQSWTQARRQLTLANIAILYQTLGQYDRALDIYNDLLKTPKALPPAEHAQLLSNVGTLRRRLGDPQKALDTYREAQSLFRQTANRDGELAVLNNIGIVQARDLSDLDGAYATFTNSMQLAAQSGSRPLAIQARLYRGEALYRAGRLEESRVDLQAASDEASHLGQLEENWKALFGLGRILARQGQTAQCDDLLKQAIGLIESLRSGLRQSSLRSGFLADKRDVYDLLIEHTSDPEEAFALMEKSRARVLQDRTRSTSVPTLPRIAKSLPKDTLLLEYWAGPSSAKLLAISNTEQALSHWDVTPAQAKALDTLPSILSDPAQQDWRRMTEEVSRHLLPDMAKFEQAGIKHIIVIPDEAMARVPFEALTIGSGLLMERFSVSYLPSAALLRVSSNSLERTLRWPWQTTVEAFANPAAGAGANITAAERAWAPLPEAAREVNGIAHALSGRADLYIGSEAKKSRLHNRLEAPILHFATHAYADQNDPAQSYILLAPASPSQRYGYLYLNEVESLNLNAVDLVTASACETDAGKLVRGEGVLSFSRAFLAAGARSVVTSLWPVGDRASANLMVDFYTRLEGRQSKAEALRKAKLEVMKQPERAHPAHWAAFVINGESQEPIPYVVSWRLLLSPLWIALAALSIGVLRTRLRTA